MGRDDPFQGKAHFPKSNHQLKDKFQMTSKTSRSLGIDLSDLYCHETLDALDADPIVKLERRGKRKDEGLDILLEAIDHMKPTKRLPTVAEPMSPEKAS